LRTVFFGSPPFAVPSFHKLLEGGLAPLGVVTAPPRRAGRGRKEVDNPVASAARDAGIPVLQPKSARDPEFLDQLRAWQPELGLVVSYGQILSEALLEIPTHGCINVHGSLLPRWRGASPVQAALLAGDERTGVCIQRVVRALDAGEVLAHRELAIAPTERGPELFERLSLAGAQLLEDFLRGLPSAGLPSGDAQDESQVTHCKKVRREDGAIAWSSPAVQIDRLVRAMYGWPWAYTSTQKGDELRVLAGEDQPQQVEGPSELPGKIISVQGGIHVQCGAGRFRVDRLQRPGKAALSAAEFLRGYTLEVGDQLQ